MFCKPRHFAHRTWVGLCFDEVISAVVELCSVPMTLIHLLDADRDWLKVYAGLPMTESNAPTSFYEQFSSFDHEMVVVEGTLPDTRLASHS